MLNDELPPSPTLPPKQGKGAVMSDGLLKRIAELEAEVAFLRHQKIICCVCGGAFDIQYTCPKCAMGLMTPIPDPSPEAGEGGSTNVNEGDK